MATENLNLARKEPFDVFDEEEGGGAKQGLIHIRIQQRTGRKTITTVQGIMKDYDFQKLVKYLKKKYNCNGTVVEHPEYGEVIQLTGDQRNNIREFLLQVGIAKDEQVKVHGF